MSSQAASPLISSAAVAPTALQQNMIRDWIEKFPPWIYPPPEFEPVDQVGYVVIPAVAAPATVVVSYRVPVNRNGVILVYGNNYVGGGFEEGTGNLYWQIRRNQQPLKGYQQILASLGSPSAPTRHPSGFRIFENDIIDIAVVNVTIVPGGQEIGGRLAGWVYPKKYDDARIWV